MLRTVDREIVVSMMSRCLSTIILMLTIALFFGVGKQVSPMWKYVESDSENTGKKRVLEFLGALPLFQYTYENEYDYVNNESQVIYSYIARKEELLIQEFSLLEKENTEAAENVSVSTETEEAETTQDSLTDTEHIAKPESEIEMEPDIQVTGSEVTGSEVITHKIVNTGLPKMVYDLSQFEDFNLMLSEFYAVDDSTTASSSVLKMKEMWGRDLHVDRNTEEPTILIYHTHSQETYIDSVPGDDSTSIMGAGKKLAEELTGYGYHVLYHEGKYDVEVRDYAYSYAAPAIEAILAENPSIQVIIDLHRDEVASDTKLVTEMNGVQVAKFMFFNGLSYQNSIGKLDYLPNPNLAENLAFSFQAQVLANEYYPGITRKIYLRGYRYNMHYRGKSMLVELGAQTNTVEEAMNAVEPLAHVIAMTLGYQKE